MRRFRRFTHRGATFKIACDRYGIATHEVIRQRRLLERYVAANPRFLKSLEPVKVGADAPDVAVRMARAASVVGVGPMAAVAGAMAQMVVEAVVAAGCNDAVVDNGGDVFMRLAAPATVVLDAGDSPTGGMLAFLVEAKDTPLSICSSSSRMGHSLSMGNCDLATVVARDGALADAAATLAGNLVKGAGDLAGAVDRVMAIPGISGVIIAVDGKVGIGGRLPRLVPGGRGATQRAGGPGRHADTEG